MKKQNSYIISDDIFMDSLGIIHENFSDIPYAIVGGGAVQIYVSSVAIQTANLGSVKEINGLSFILRKTGDIDLSFNYEPADLIKKFNLIISHASCFYTFHSFTKRFVLQHGDQRFNLNYQTEPDDLKGIPAYYHDIIDTAISLELPYKSSILQLKIARPEYLVISKLTRARPKDQIDIALILKAAEMSEYPFDSEEVRSVLKSVNAEDKYNILAELMDANG